MTDAELNLLSAAAIFPPERIRRQGNGLVWITEYFPANVKPRTAPWKPLADGHQALMLVEKLKLEIIFGSFEAWSACATDGTGRRSINADLRRAIVLCAAQLAPR